MDNRLIITRDAFKHGRGTPSGVPDFIGQPYIDIDTHTVWHAVSLDGPEYWTSGAVAGTSNLPFIVATELGAVPDGKTPSSYAINSAIEQASVLNQVGAVYLPGGVYIIDAPILLKDNIYLFGDGFTVLKQADLSNIKCIFQYYSSTEAGTYPNTEYNITISNLILDGNNFTNTTYSEGYQSDADINCGIIMEHAHNCHFDSIEIRNCGFDGIVMKDSTDNNRNVFSNVSVRNCGRYGAYIGLTNAHNRFDNCSFEFNQYDNAKSNGPFNIWNSCRLGSSSVGNGITVTGADTVVTNCELVDNGAQGILATDSHYLSVIGCKLAGNSRNSAGKLPHIKASGTGLHISGNQFVGAVTSMTDASFANCCVELGAHSGCNFSSNSVYFNTVNSKIDLSSQFIKGLSIGDSINGIVIIDANQRPQPTPGVLYLEDNTGLLVYYNFTDKEWVRLKEPPGENKDWIVKSLVSSTYVRANTITATKTLSSPEITATTTSSETVSATKSLSTPQASITELSSDDISVDDLTVAKSMTSASANISSLTTNSATVTSLSATTLTGQNLTAQSLKVNGNTILFGSAPPTTGTYVSGDIVINTSSDSGIVMWKYSASSKVWSPVYTDLVLTMPEPSTDAKTNTSILQSYLDVAKLGVPITVKFRKGTYPINYVSIWSNTTLLLGTETILTTPGTSSMIYNAKPGSGESDSVTEYNGHSNITIRGGTMMRGCLSFIHGNNILVEDVVFKNSACDHVFQICACKNFTIRNCIFEGKDEESEDRRYVEMIQLDPCTQAAFPSWSEGSATYDRTPCRNILIEGCEFRQGTTDQYSHMYTCIGSHSFNRTGNFNECIEIKRCKFKDYIYAGVRIQGTRYVVVSDCEFESKHNTTSSDIRVEVSDNVTVERNTVTNGGALNKGSVIGANDVNNLRLSHNVLVGCSGDVGCHIFVRDSKDCTIDHNIIQGGTIAYYPIQVRDCQQIRVYNNTGTGITTAQKCLVNIYNSSEPVTATKDFIVYHNHGDNYELSIGSDVVMDSEYVSLIDADLAIGGTATLPLALNRLKDLFITIDCCGVRELVANIVDTTLILNIQSVESDKVHFIELKFTKVSETQLKFESGTQIVVGSSGVPTTETCNAVVKSLKGKLRTY